MAEGLEENSSGDQMREKKEKLDYKGVFLVLVFFKP